jgi:hypothetical protein
MVADDKTMMARTLFHEISVVFGCAGAPFRYDTDGTVDALRTEEEASRFG